MRHVGQKSSATDSVSKHRNQVYWTRFLSKEIESTGLGFCSWVLGLGSGEWDGIWRKKGKEEQRKKNPSKLTKIECFELNFHKRKASPLCSIFGNRVLCTRIVRKQISLKCFLTNDIVWVL